MYKIQIADSGDSSVGIPAGCIEVHSDWNLLDGLDKYGKENFRLALKDFFCEWAEMTGRVYVEFEGEQGKTKQ